MFKLNFKLIKSINKFYAKCSKLSFMPNVLELVLCFMSKDMLYAKKMFWNMFYAKCFKIKLSVYVKISQTRISDLS